jgi:hypothetical protein
MDTDSIGTLITVPFHTYVYVSKGPNTDPIAPPILGDEGVSVSKIERKV